MNSVRLDIAKRVAASIASPGRSHLGPYRDQDLLFCRASESRTFSGSSLRPTLFERRTDFPPRVTTRPLALIRTALLLKRAQESFRSMRQCQAVALFIG